MRETDSHWVHIFKLFIYIHMAVSCFSSQWSFRNKNLSSSPAGLAWAPRDTGAGSGESGKKAGCGWKQKEGWYSLWQMDRLSGWDILMPGLTDDNYSHQLHSTVNAKLQIKCVFFFFLTHLVKHLKIQQWMFVGRSCVTPGRGWIFAAGEGSCAFSTYSKTPRPRRRDMNPFSGAPACWLTLREFPSSICNGSPCFHSCPAPPHPPTFIFDIVSRSDL